MAHTCASTYIFYSDHHWNVDINDLETILNSPVNVPLGNISLQIRGQRAYST